MTSDRGIDRREFIKVVGGGVVVLVRAGPSALLAQRGNLYPEDLNAYLRIGEDGRVTVLTCDGATSRTRGCSRCWRPPSRPSAGRPAWHPPGRAAGGG